MSEENWIEVGSTHSIEEEDLIRFDHQDKTFCVYRLTDGFYATDGICTHEAVHLEDGLVMDDEIECPMHQGIFNIKSGIDFRIALRVSLRITLEHIFKYIFYFS